MQSPWARLAVNYYQDPKILAVSAHAELLYVRLIAYTVAHETDGVVPMDCLQLCSRRVRNVRALVQELCLSHALVVQQDGTISFPLETWKRWQEPKKLAGQGREERRPRAGAGERRAAGECADLLEEKRREERTSTLEIADPEPPPVAPPPDLAAALDKIGTMKWNGGATNGAH